MIWVAAPAAAQSLELAVDTDRRARGLSETGGRASASMRADIALTESLHASAEGALLRGSPRHGGADLGTDLALGYRLNRGLWSFDAGAVARLFIGAAGKLDYGEAYIGTSYALGPALVGLSASYAPKQSAIGGDNLYFRAHAAMGIPGTPITMRGHIGRSSGTIDDVVKAARLRPGGRFIDWSFGADLARGPLTLGLSYSGTDMSRAIATGPFADPRHSGSALVGRIGYSF